MAYSHYIFHDEEGQHHVPPERWAWGVVYDDGTELKQFDDNGFFHQIGEVEQDRVVMFVMYKLDDPDTRIDVLLPKGGRIIHKYRNFVFNAKQPHERRAKVYMFGYKVGNNYHYNFILPDDRIVQSDTQEVKLTGFNI